MLEKCGEKGFASELNVLDITKEKVPYGYGYFHHILCHGVLHFFNDLGDIFKEISRILRPGGTFAFTVMCRSDGGPDGNVIETMDTKWGRDVNYHGRAYIEGIAQACGFEIINSLLYIGGIDPESGEKHFNWVYLLRKI
jgi:SAM-dependent methyltransferase